MDGEEGEYIQPEAEESSDAEEDSEDSEEEEEGEGDIDGLINDNPEEGEGGSGEEVSGEESAQSGEQEGEAEGERKKKRKRKAVDDQLDEDDLELIKENIGFDIQAKKQRRAHFESDDEEEEEEGGRGRGREEGRRMEDERARNNEISQVFGGDDSDDEELPSSGLLVRQGGERRRELDEEEGTEEEGPTTDDMGDFIVGDDGRPISITRLGGMESEPALMEAQEIFGLDFDDPSEFSRVAEEGLGSDEEEEEEDDYLSGEEEEEEDEEGGASQRRRRRRLRKAKKKASIYDVYEPSELEKGFFTDRDKDIRVTDMPERFQTRSLAVQKTEEGELDEEAEWIFQNVFSKHPISKQPLSFSQKPRGGGGRGGSGAYTKPPSAVPKIREALNFMRNHSFEVPFIANYRKEYVEPELDIHDLWAIWQSDEKWMQLKQRKAQMVKLFQRLQDYQFEKLRQEPDKALTEDTRPLSEDDIIRLKAVKTAEELSDVFAQFSLYYGRDLVDMQHLKAMQKRQGDNEDQELEVLEGEAGANRPKKKTAIKQAHRKTFYVACQEAGLGSLAAKFGLTPEQFGENLRDNYQRHETEQHSVEPEEVAQDFVQPSGVFTSVRKVLQGACHMVALQLAAEPLVRQAVRHVFQTRALLTVKPTKKGKKMIDEAHPCAGMKYLRNKPVKDLAGADFLRLVQAEGEGLLETKIGIDLDQGAQESRRPGSLQSYFEEIRQLFYRDEFSRLVEKWNAQRAQAVYSALVKFLYPLMQRELHTKLLIEAREHILRSCVQRFRDWLDVAPLSAKREDEEDSYLSQQEGPFTRVVAVAFGADKSVPAFCCSLDSNGSVVDYRRLPNLLKRRISPSEKERNEKEKDLESFKDFVSRKRPGAIAVAADSRDALSLVDDLHNALVELEGEEGVPVVPVELVNSNVAKIFSKSPRAKESYPEYPELLCEAVSLGRRLQEPLLEFTALACAEDDELLSLTMDPLQSALDSDELRACLELELVTRVNDVGVDVNFCLEHPHGVGMLPFICGLGPRKAMFLLKILKQENSLLKNRSELVTQCSTGPQVFINCAGFIRIDTNAFNDDTTDNTYIEVLDSTRVHPETYEWARKMAVDALEYDETGDEGHPSAAVDDILLTPDKLRDLDLDAFAEELERQDYGNKRTTLYDIRDELFSPYKERRKPYQSLSSEEKFSLLTGETPDSLFKGRLVTCTVVGIVRRKPPREVLDRANPIENKATGYWQCPFCLKDDFRELSMVWQHFDDGSCPGQGIGVRARLENGLSGFIHTKNLSDSQVNAPEERVHIGMTIHARILTVNVEKFSVDLTCRSSDLKDTEGRFSVAKDVYFDKQAAEADQRKEEAAHKHPKQRYIKRVIVHPAFLNASFKEVEKELAKMELGEAIFRPSSKGTDHLTLTWKVEEGILHHIDIREQGKPNQFSLGKSLWIGSDEYEDLDEILARFIQPMAALARDLITHKVYRPASGGDRKTLERLLSDERKKNPKRIPYFFSAVKKSPGKFCLAYQPGSKPFIEYFSLTPEGYRYRGKVHSTVNALITWFKGHYRDPIPRPVPSSQAMPPPQTHNRSYHTPQHSVASPMSSIRTGGSTPYTPQWPTATPPPHYGGHQASSYSQPPGHQYSGYSGGGYQQQYRGGTTGAAPYGGGSYQGGYQGRSGGGGGRGGGWGVPQQNWVSAQSYSRTPGQTPGQTPAYTPTQTPGSYMGSLTGTPHSRSSHPRHTPASPLQTPILDE